MTTRILRLRRSTAAASSATRARHLDGERRQQPFQLALERGVDVHLGVPPGLYELR
ncbi:MAG TPA: hypothetical protein VIP78_08500 [Candidatus Dormibacteraeota bacterium]